MKTKPFHKILFSALLMHVSLFGFSQTILFQENFEDSTSSWWNNTEGFTVINENGNGLLKVEGNSEIDLGKKEWMDYRYSIDAKLLSGWFWLKTRLNSQGVYGLSVDEAGVELSRGCWDGTCDTIFSRVPLDIGLNKWHIYKIDLVGNYVKVFIDNELIFNIYDSSPMLNGQFGFHNPDGITMYDNILVESDQILPKQEFPWIRTGGPWGGIGYDVRIDPYNPERIYVTDQWAGNHKSIDGGKNWHPNNNGISSVFGSTGQSVPIFCLTIDPTYPNNIWCGTANQKGIYKSTDYGENWELKVNGIPDFDCGITFRGIAIRPDNSNVVYCASENTTCPGEAPPGKDLAPKGKIFKSTDGGENWYEVLNSNALVRHILINPEHPDTMYASTGIFDRDCIQEEGVWKSVDAGESWFHANIGLTDLTVGGLHMDPNNPEVLWACTGRETPFGGDMTGEIFVSRNGADSWEQVLPKGSALICHTVNSITTAGKNSDIIYAASECGFYVSFDGGENWEFGMYDIDGVYTGIPVGIAAHPSNESTVMINSYTGGVFESEDYGKTWQINSKGYTGAEMYDLFVDPFQPAKVMTLGRSGIGKTSNGGDTWEGAGQSNNIVNIGENPIGGYSILEMNPLNNKSVLAADYTGAQLIKTKNWLKWNLLYDFRDIGVIGVNGIGDVAYAKSDSSIIYLGFRQSTLPLVIDRPHHYDPSLISYGVAKSEDSGHSWEFINSGLEETTKNIQTIKSHPTNKNIAYIGVYGFGVYKTENGGQAWEQKNTGLSSYLIVDISICEVNPDIIYVGAEDGGIFKTIDGGENWKPVMHGLDPEASVRSIVFHPGSVDTLYVSDWHTGVNITRHGGAFWVPFNESLSQRSIQKLAIAEDASILYAATQGSGVFRLPLKEFEPEIVSVLPDTLETITIYEGDSILFNIDAYDIDDVNLNYSWIINGRIIENTDIGIFNFYSDTLGIGIHTVNAHVSDSISTKTINWQVQIISKINTNTNSINSYNTLDFKIIPNPNFGTFVFEPQSVQVNNLTLKLINPQGQVIETRVIDNTNIRQTEKFDISRLAKGVYYLVAYTDKFQKSRKIVVL